MIMKINLQSSRDANVGIPFHPSFWPGVAFPSLHQYVRFQLRAFLTHTCMHVHVLARRGYFSLLLFFFFTLLKFSLRQANLHSLLRASNPLPRSSELLHFPIRRHHCFPRMSKCFFVLERGIKSLNKYRKEDIYFVHIACLCIQYLSCLIIY